MLREERRASGKEQVFEIEYISKQSDEVKSLENFKKGRFALAICKKAGSDDNRKLREVRSDRQEGRELKIK